MADCLGVETELEAVRRPPAAATRAGQPLPFLLTQSYHLPLKVSGSLLFAEQLVHPPGNRVHIRVTSAFPNTLLGLLQALLELFDLLLAVFADHFLVGRAEDEDHSSGNHLAAFRVGQLMIQCRQFIVLPRKLTVPISATSLFDRQIAGGIESQVSMVLVEQGPELLPGGRADGRVPLGIQPCQVSDRIGAPIREQRQLSRPQMFPHQGQLLDHRTVPVLACLRGGRQVPVHGMPEDGQRPQLVHVSAQSDVDHACGLGGVEGGPSLCDVGRLQVLIAQDSFLVVDLALGLGVFVGPIKQDVGGIVMEFGEGNVELVGYVQGHTSQDGVSLGEHGVQGPPQPVVVDLFHWDVPEDIGAALCGPLGDVDQGHGVVQPGSDEQTEDRAVVVLGLRIGGQVLIDDLCHLHALQQGKDHGQGPQVTAICGRLVRIVGAHHVRNMANIRA